jgi:hypothetical protein
MIEVIVRFELTPELDKQNYQQWTRKAIQSIMQAPGIEEVRANRSLIGSQVRIVLVWEKAANWAEFAEKPAWLKLITELTNFTRDIQVEIWGPSPIVPEPLRIKKKRPEGEGGPEGQDHPA